MQNSITILCGLSGSGKSTWTDAIKDHYLVLCPDEFRLALTGQYFFKGAEEAVWSAVKTAARVFAKQHKDLLIDATAITRGQRAQWVQLAIELEIPIHCIVFDTPLDICLDRNNARARRVPETVIRKQYELFQHPTDDEGFASIKVINGKTENTSA
jgi:predicted kinase